MNDNQDFSTSSFRRLRTRDLQIGWANVARRSECHDAILNISFQEGLDVLCIQEPWTGTGTRTKSHPSYHKYAPVDSWDWEDIEQREEVRPRVLIYIKKSPDLQIQQRRPVPSRDLLWITINGYTILNIYRAPGDDVILEYVISLLPPEKCLIGGDFNVHHDFFEPGVDTYGRGGELVDWATNNLMDYIGEWGIPTHAAGMFSILRSLIFRML